MSAPFYKFGFFGDEVSLIVAFVTGIAFGFFLERAGFGNARVLAAQFYFRDLRVLKVMFTAIITAMTGLFVLAWLGWVDLSLVYLTPTLVAPQIVGGLILGAGFIIGGYCPGTSCVAAATGRIDGVVYLAGMIGGLLGFAEIFPRIAGFAKSTGLGQVTIPQFLNLPYGVVVLAVVIMAIGAFLAAEWAEQRIGGRQPDGSGLLLTPWRLTPVRKLAGVLLLIALFAAVAGNPYRGSLRAIDTQQLAQDISTKAHQVSPEQLAEALIAGGNQFVIVDVRDSAAFERYHIPGAIHVPVAALNRDFASRSDRILCYSDQDTDGVQAALLVRTLGFPAAYSLSGGLDAWKANVLFPVSSAGDGDLARRVAVARHFGGAGRDGAGQAAPAVPDVPRLIVPPAGAPTSPLSAPRKKKEGC